jgi:hypothetical protein
MIYPVIPSDKKVIILVDYKGVRVARYIEYAPFMFEVQLADNWQALEPAALAAVTAQIGAISGPDIYPCPDDLAALAVWPGE